ncbi:DMT family transporter [Desulfobulbus alkaliphilus]|uniref:DMT family transporter n=1 Tax=Desulfobulbus alkaliphilus TaxID=869814 RepID=UPI0019629F31|nr:DMT family transporter [Desulfobulbus alkaliphilus]MBM9536250.1 DMT family transporter [Desulfobulbus alkaliphilus]
MNTTGIVTAILAALFMGTVGIFSRATGLEAETFTFFRLTIGAGFMLLFLVATSRLHLAWSRSSWPVLLNGTMLAGLIICYVRAMEYTTMANAVMLLYLAPPVTAIYAHCFLGERLTRASTFLISLTLFGFMMMMEFRIDFSGDENLGKGLVFGLLSMCCYAAFILINRSIDQSIHVYTRTFHQLLIGGLLLLPFSLLHRPELPLSTWPWLAATGLVPGFFAILCAVIALSRLPAATFGTLAYFEPIAVVVFGWTLFNESLSPLQCAGCLLIVVSGTLKAWFTVSGPEASRPRG